MRILHLTPTRPIAATAATTTNASASSSADSSSNSKSSALLASTIAAFAASQGELHRHSLAEAVALVKQSLQTQAIFDCILIEYDAAAIAAYDSAAASATAASWNARASSSSTPAARPGSAADLASTKTGQTPFLQLILQLATLSPASFLVIVTLDEAATESASFRWRLFQHRCHMLTSILAIADLKVALSRLVMIVQAKSAAAAAKSSSSPAPVYSCPFCTMSGLPEDALHLHTPLFHANTRQDHRQKLSCPVCRVPQRNLCVHLYNHHGPQGRGEVENEEQLPNVIYPYALVIVRRPSDGKFLMCQEFSNSGFWLPGGRAENGESLTQAAKRETREEAGVEIQLKGILRLEYSSQKSDHPDQSGLTRLRIFFYAEPIESPVQCGKTLPDYESVGAAWVAVEELDQLQLRGSEPRKWFPYVANGGEIHPMSLLTMEGAE